MELTPDAILQAITEFDEPVNETKKTFEQGYFETDSRDRTTKAIEEAAKLIEDALA